MFRYLKMMMLAAVPAALIAVTPAPTDAAHRRHHRDNQRYGGAGDTDRPQRHYYDGDQPYIYRYDRAPYRYGYSPWGGYDHDHGHHEHYGVRTPWGSCHFYDD